MNPAISKSTNVEADIRDELNICVYILLKEMTRCVNTNDLSNSVIGMKQQVSLTFCKNLWTFLVLKSKTV